MPAQDMEISGEAVNLSLHGNLLLQEIQRIIQVGNGKSNGKSKMVFVEGLFIVEVFFGFMFLLVFLLNVVCKYFVWIQTLSEWLGLLLSP